MTKGEVMEEVRTAVGEKFLVSTATRDERNRSVKYEWKVGTLLADGGYGERDVMAVLSISHHKAGFNYWNGERTAEDYFSVSLTNEAVERSDGGFTARSFMLFSGLGIMRIAAGNRYSAKKLREAAGTGYARFRELVEAGDERVLAYLAGEMLEAGPGR